MPVIVLHGCLVIENSHAGTLHYHEYMVAG